MTNKRKPYILILSHPLTGHITPMLSVAGALLPQGWDVGFIGPTAHRDKIGSAGCEFFPLRGKADINDLVGTQAALCDGVGGRVSVHMRRILSDTRVQCYDTIPDQWECIKEVLSALHARDADRQVVVICEAFVHGILPLKYGAGLPPGVPEPRTICVSVTPPMIRTRLQPPFYCALPYDPSPAGEARAAELWDEWGRGVGAEMGSYLDAKIMQAGGRRRTKQLFLEGANYTCHDSILQFGLGSFEYPRDDWPPGRFQFIGLPMPKGRRGVSEAEVRDIPWWKRFVANAELPAREPTRSKVVVVTQGTVEADANELIVPTLQAVTRLGQEESMRLFLVVILGMRNASLPPSVRTVPPNVGVVDYLRYGAVLPYADVWVHNGGYGAVSQGIAEGVPMIVAGEGQDKAENARRVAWSGMGLDLKTARPTAEQVANALLEVLRDGSQYRDKVNDAQNHRTPFTAILPIHLLKMAIAPLRIGFVPEHFSTPLHFAQQHFGLQADLIPFPSGTGHMITAIRASEIDVGIGLTEGWIAGLGKEDVKDDGGYRLVGTYVETPLCWAISTGTNRSDITSISSLKGGKIGVSRIGSGSYVMGFVLADREGWLQPNVSPFSQTVVLNTFENLRKAVNSSEADFFMWEHFTSKKYYDSGEIRRVGEIYTPWSSWKIVASTKLLAGGQRDARVTDLLGKLDQGIKYFNENKEEAVKYISTALDYSEEDARAWLDTVKFPAKTDGVKEETVDKCVNILRKAGVLTAGKGMEPKQMVA
ncbi:hypothetical protein PpBr36_02803 [Pyricularia pennisetigena]|uniref:hypothetical protein n=1 Tax=Pyricularia pennisetigena TaxID=1578925 RepID=UPI00114F4479|nr:hypothetical protein PpBr36_02803 [Pyricularia pennisetigena]TLS30055.1 hypothetical protein PpBr36_02803 [Pyricularia pennisetigena]